MTLTAVASSFKGFAQSFKAAITDNDSTAMEPLGIVRYTDNGIYKYVKFSGTTAAAVGDYVGYVVSDTALQTVDAASVAVGAGVVCATTVASGSVSYGWIQIGGTVIVNGVTASAGNMLKQTGSKTLGVRAADTDDIVGIAVTAASGATAYVALNTRF